MSEAGLAPLALVTGASRGLGEVVAGVLASAGYRLLITARNAGPLEEVAARLRGRSAEVHTVVGDVSEEAHREKVVRKVRELGRLDILVNNASELGPSPLPPLVALPLESFRRTLEVNVLAPVALVQELRPWLERSQGLVINISSDAAIGGYPGWGGYGASKAALDLLTKTWAGELAERHVAVVGVDPGDLRTAMHQAAYPGQDISDRPLPEVTVPFWSWLLGQERSAVSGRRFQAQADRWEVGRPAP